MLKIENWEIFPDPVVLPITDTNRYVAYGMTLPDSTLIDKKMRTRLGQYLLDENIPFDFAYYRENYIIMYVSISPKLQPGWTLKYGLFRAA